MSERGEIFIWITVKGLMGKVIFGKNLKGIGEFAVHI